ncbi:MAG: biopolymer transporter ExbD [Woeseiaceae bacterium]
MARAIAVRRSDDNDEINLTPMLDVVFIMLIFFVVTATFIKETGIDVNRPQADRIDPVSDASILVAISENNEIWIDGRTVDIRALRAHIERLHAENPKGGVVIQADGQSNNDTFVKVMNASREAGVYDIAIAAVKPGS